MRAGVAAVFALGVIYSSLVSYYGHSGWTKTALLDFQNERILVYFLIFLLGALGRREAIFDELPRSKRLYYMVSATLCSSPSSMVNSSSRCAPTAAARSCT